MSNFIQDLLCNDLNIIQELTNLNYQARDEINQSNASLHGLTDMNIELVDSDDLLKLIEMYKKKNEHSFKDRIELESHQNMLTIIEESKKMFSDPNNYDVIIECEKDEDGKCVYKGVSIDTKNNIDELHKANKLQKPLTLLYKENSDYPIVYYDSSKVKYAYNTKSGIARNVGGALAIAGLMVVGSLMAKFTSIGASSAADTIGDAIDPKGFGKAYSISSSGKIEKSRVNSGEILGTAAVAYVGKKTINQFVSIHDQMVNPLSEDASTFFKLKLLIKNCSCSKNINDTTTLEHNLMKARTEIKYSIIPKLIKVIFIGLIVATIVYFTGGLILPILLGVAKKLFMKDMNKKADNVSWINNTKVSPIFHLLDKIDWKSLSNGTFAHFHGDPQPENVIVKGDNDFIMIDWREDFGGNLEYGDIYYDFGKIYHSLIITQKRIREEKYFVSYEGAFAKYKFSKRMNLIKYLGYFETFLTENNYSLSKVKLISALIYLNIAPLHHHPYSDLLFFHGKLTLSELLKK